MSVGVFFRIRTLVANGVRAVVASVKAVHVARTVVGTVSVISQAQRSTSSFRLILSNFYTVARVTNLYNRQHYCFQKFPAINCLPFPSFFKLLLKDREGRLERRKPAEPIRFFWR